MKVVVQRVNYSKLTIDNKIYSEINNGLLVLVGVTHNDDLDDISWLSKKIINLRIFNDSSGVMNLSLKQVAGELMVISQFTLMASTKKGNRPSYIRAAKHETAIPLYEYFLAMAEKGLGKQVSKGVFGADMIVSMVNDGPVTIFIDSKKRE